jgi:hypothetical protein
MKDCVRALTESIDDKIRGAEQMGKRALVDIELLSRNIGLVGISRPNSDWFL